MANKSPTLREIRDYLGSSLKLAWEGSPFLSSFKGISMAMMTAVLSAYEQIKPLKEALKIFAIAAVLYSAFWLIEILYKTFCVSPIVRNKQQQQVIAAFEETAKIQLSMEGVKCQWSVKKHCICRLAIRNLSRTNPAQNVFARIEGKILPEFGYRPGYDPFNDADLVPSTGHHLINPSDTADFVFPDSVNEMVQFFGNGGIRRSKKPQTFKIIVSSSTSQSIKEEFVIVANSDRHVSIIKNINFEAMPEGADGKGSFSIHVS